jgi:hypothetical protein
MSACWRIERPLADNGPVKPRIEAVHGIGNGLAALPLWVIVQQKVHLPLVIWREVIKRGADAKDGQAFGIFPPGIGPERVQSG